MGGRDHGIKAVGWWTGLSTSTSRISLSTITWIGAIFTVTSDVRLMGARINVPPSLTPQPVYAIWELYSNEFIRIGGNKLPAIADPVNEKWCNHWYLPRGTLNHTKTYCIAVQMYSTYIRKGSYLTAPITRNGITFQSGFQSTAVAPWLATITSNTNANAVDVLVEPL